MLAVGHVCRGIVVTSYFQLGSFILLTGQLVNWSTGQLAVHVLMAGLKYARSGAAARFNPNREPLLDNRQAGPGIRQPSW